MSDGRNQRDVCRNTDRMEVVYSVQYSMEIRMNLGIEVEYCMQAVADSDTKRPFRLPRS